MAQKTKSINLFATKDDWHSLLARVEEQLAVYYVLGGRLTEPLCRIKTYQQLEDLGSASSGNASSERICLCVRDDTEIEIRSIEQRNGGQLDFVDQQSNPDTIALKSGGRFGGNVIVAGQIGTISGSDWSLRAFAIFQKEVRKQFEQVKSYHVGKEARSLLEQGWRLTANVRSPGEYDLSLA